MSRSTFGSGQPTVTAKPPFSSPSLTSNSKVSTEFGGYWFRTDSSGVAPGGAFGSGPSAPDTVLRPSWWEAVCVGLVAPRAVGTAYRNNANTNTGNSRRTTVTPPVDWRGIMHAL